MEMKSRTRRLLIGTGILGVAGIGLAALAYLRTQSDAVVRSPLPNGVSFLPRSAFGSKPKVDVPWFGGKRLQYPPVGTMPKEFKDQPYIAGILTWKDPPKAAKPPVTIFEMSTLGPYVFAFAEWKAQNGQCFETYVSSAGFGSGWPSYAILPSVYGNKPAHFEVDWLNAFELTLGANELPPKRKMSVDLPPLGKPPPQLEGTTVSLGRWKMIARPRPLVSPEFLPIYDFELQGADPGQSFLLEIQDHEIIRSGSDIGFIVHGSQPFSLAKRWTERATIVLRQVEQITFPVTARKSATGVPLVLDLIGSDGKILAEATSSPSMTHVYALPGASHYFNLSVGPHFISPRYSKPGTLLASLEASTKSRANQPPIKDGQKLQVTGFKQIAKAVGTLVLEGPAEQAGFRPEIEETPTRTKSTKGP